MKIRRLAIMACLLCYLHGVAQQTASYPEEVRTVLRRTGRNAPELEKVLAHYKSHPQKLAAACFLIGNMDGHQSQSYYWANSREEKIPFDEAGYGSYEEAVTAFNRMSAMAALHPVRYETPDPESVTAEFLIGNIDNAFSVWGKRWSAQLPFEEFCEYLLPYRIMNEPLAEWRESYGKEFSEPFRECESLKVRAACTHLCNKHRGWFTNLFNMDLKKELQDVLSPRQILFRRQGYCEDMANWGVYMLRSLGIASTIDYTPFWATSTGGHFWQVAFDESGTTIPFFMGDDTPAEFFMRREPSKVLRITYSQRKESLASLLPQEEIPPGFLRRRNYIDVTDQYWPVAPVDITFDAPGNREKTGYLAVFNGGRWHVVWWSKIRAGRGRFDKMTRGVVYLPVTYRGGKEVPSASPYLLKSDGSAEHLKPDKSRLQAVVIRQESSYLRFRPSAKYTLYYWGEPGQWIPLGTQTPGARITPDSHLHFHNAPHNALFILIPEYSQYKERPFTIDEQGKMNWW